MRKPTPVSIPDDEEIDEDDAAHPTRRILRNTKPVKPGKGIAKPAPSPLIDRDFVLPPLSLLAEPKHFARTEELSDDILEQNARMLESVLDDFGVRGEIINVEAGTGRHAL